MTKISSTKMRVIIPTNVSEILSLADKVYQKHLSDGATSILNILQDYNWSVEGPKIVSALQLHENAKQKSREWEKAYKERDILLIPIDEIVKASRDLLTGVHRNNMKRLGDWGFVVNDSTATGNINNSLKMRVVIPKNPTDLMELATKIYQKHTNDGVSSPLNFINDYDWNVVGPTIANAMALHNDAESLKAEAETLHRDRDIIIPNLIGILKASRDLLTGANPKNMKRLTDWGFQVDNSIRKKRKDKTDEEEMKM